MDRYREYKEQSVLMMTPGEQLVLLYDETIKSFHRAEIFLEDAEYEMFEDEMKHARDVIRYLNRILDREQPISGELENLYNFLLMNIGKVLAGRERKKEEISSMVDIVTEIRDGFQAVISQGEKLQGGTDDRKVFG